VIRHLPFRAKLGLLVLPPLVVLIIALVAVTQPRFAAADRANANSRTAIAAREAQALVNRVHDEAGLSNWAQTRSEEAIKRLKAARAETDAQQARFVEAYQQLPASRKGSFDNLFNGATDFSNLRRMADEQTGDSGNAFRLYTDRAGTLIGFTQSAVASIDDPDLAKDTAQITTLLSASQQVAKIRGTLMPSLEVRRFSPNSSTELRIDSAVREELDRQYGTTSNTARLWLATPAVVKSRTTVSSAEVAIATNSDVAITPQQWWNIITGELEAYRTQNRANFDRFVNQAAQNEQTARNQIRQFALLGLIGLMGSALVVLITGRNLANRITRVTEAANDVATLQLPLILASSGSLNPEEVSKSIPVLERDASDEIGRLASSFNTVMRTAVETSIGHAQQRSKMATSLLVNLGRRNQTLIDKQLKLMDRMQAKHQDPDLLEGLFQIDHVVTRMRRNAENLLVLAGEHKSRTWTEPVPLFDVLRASGQEVSDLNRIVYRAPGAEQILVSGAYAVDLSHLLAELIENSQSFSPPSTKVVVRTDSSTSDLRVWVIDEGVGFDSSDLATANERLSSPGSVDNMTTDRIGLHVVGRLAKRLGCNVVLAPNPQGGTAAVVTVPNTLFEVRDDQATTPRSAQAAPAETPARVSPAEHVATSVEESFGSFADRPVAPKRTPASAAAPSATPLRKPASPLEPRDHQPIGENPSFGRQPIDPVRAAAAAAELGMAAPAQAPGKVAPRRDPAPQPIPGGDRVVASAPTTPARAPLRSAEASPAPVQDSVAPVEAPPVHPPAPAAVDPSPEITTAGLPSRRAARRL
jgi:signal transduction histidine kinase